MTTEAAGSTRAGELLRRPWIAALVVLAVYGFLALLNSTDGYLGTDTGAKVITLDRMAEDDTFSPAVGYWAEEWDPAGEYHPLLDTTQNEDGEWINVTTLPMLLAARPLYELGGYRAALLLPMLGGVLAAFAVRDLARQLGDERAGWTAYWIVALASPITVYALDLWEHSIGAGLMVLAATLLLRVARGTGGSVASLLAGAALGLAATMRTEALVVTAVVVAGAGTVLVVRRRPVRAVLTGALATTGFAVPWLLNARLERALGGSSRAARASTAAGLVGSSTGTASDEAVVRGKEALVTWFGVPGAAYPASVALGAVIVACILGATVLSRRGEARSARILAAVACAGYLLMFTSGLGFVPGALVAAPVAVLAVTLARWTAERVYVLAAAVTGTVIIWSFQFIGGAGPQWGGRYVLAPTMLLVAVGAVAAGSSERWLRGAVFVAAAAVTLFGVAWLNVRSHGVEDLFDELAARPEDVVISANGFLVREAGPAYDDRRYLSVGRGGTLDGAVDVVRRAGLESFGILSESAEPELRSGTHRGSERVDFIGVPLWYHRYVL